MSRHSYVVVDMADPGASIVMLAVAQLCQDCEAITAAGNGRCARCGSQSLLSIAKVLNREEEEKPPVHPVEVRISIGGDNFEYVQRVLSELDREAFLRDADSFRMCSGGAGGSYSVTTVTRDISAEDFRAELAAWFERRRAGGAR
ncbi:hypothetical protein [Occallatibacter riparius]|uniref:Uncharacterized protein n=1 Tax=Occallatibacter riparius TaxID=1002689 RepID=A0A9J7BS84_9BACT|nr:hypothetical protein [Occallatibacter riparius]UWZ84626.1 hypothetical protein MOP44_01525 [Occallatibacter riparius]